MYMDMVYIYIWLYSGYFILHCWVHGIYHIRWNGNNRIQLNPTLNIAGGHRDW